ncbi:hypothetical protein [Nitrosomonas eutropha]|uniref:hypothetical protein n=1 Tax=Nitrosomonas eutropha TaxID=916 RepID=UPI0002D52E7C|nr:hypothetical protein [Nitrosomonas eutropha]
MPAIPGDGKYLLANYLARIRREYINVDSYKIRNKYKSIIEAMLTEQKQFIDEKS